MDIGSMASGTYQRPVHAPANRHITNICQRTDFQGIKCSLVKRLIACNGSNSQQVNIGMVGCEKDSNGIIMAGVTVENNFVFHLFTFARPRWSSLQKTATIEQQVSNAALWYYTQIFFSSTDQSS